jgi:hypothetical protein
VSHIFFPAIRLRVRRIASPNDRGSIYLQLGEGETTAGTDTAVVLDGRAPDNGTQLVDGARSNGSGLGDTGLTTAVLAAGLKIRGKKRMLVDQVLSSKKFSHSMPVGRREIVRREKEKNFRGKGIGSRTWSKCTRTRRCQSLRKSIESLLVHQSL